MRMACLTKVLGIGALGFLTGWIGAVPVRAGGLAPGLARKVAAAPGSSELARVVVRFQQSGVDRKALARALGGRVAADHPLIDGATLLLPKRVIQTLSRRSDVAWVSEDEDVGASCGGDVQATGADQVLASTGLTGTGIRVAVLDTGVNTGCPDWNSLNRKQSRIVAWIDLVTGQPSPYDDNGHGTHVAGIVLANKAGGQYPGIAPNADLVAVKVLDANGQGHVSTVINGIDWCIQNKNTFNIRVINLSLGHHPSESYRTDPLCAAVRRAVQAGIVVVCAAGNNGKGSNGATCYGGVDCPGNDPSAITVGAVNTYQTVDRSDDTVCPGLPRKRQRSRVASSIRRLERQGLP